MATWTRAYDENGNLVKIEDARRENFYKCPVCGVEMKIKRGEVREQHFYHFPQQPVSCSDESFYHFMAKILFQERFRKKDSLIFSFSKKVRCNAICDHKTINCIKYFTENIHVHDIYDTCRLECPIGVYKADILLTNSKDNSIEPLLIEIWYSHKNSYQKANSGYKIIEIKIKSEEDLQIFNEPVIKESDNVQFYGFDEEKDLSSGCFKYEKDNSLSDIINAQNASSIQKTELRLNEGQNVVRHPELLKGRHCYTCHYSYGWAGENNVVCYRNADSRALGLLSQDTAENCGFYEFSDKFTV